MKTKEFIKRVEELSGCYEVKINDCTCNVVFSDYGDIFATISRTQINDLYVDSSSCKLIDLCLEYTKTPIEEREDEKKYIVVIPEEVDFPIKAVLTIRSGKVYISQKAKGFIKDNTIFHLTEKEIKRSFSYLWQFAKEVEMD